jgi:integrase
MSIFGTTINGGTMAERVWALTREEALSVLARLKGTGSRRDVALWALGIGTGLRISDLLRLRGCDFVTAKGHVDVQLVVRASQTKKARNVQLIPLAREAVEAYLPELRRTELLFPITRQHARRLVKEWCEAANVDGQFGTHSMRKTFATIAYENSGGDAALTARVTGHSNPAQLMTYIGRTPATEQSVWDGVCEAFAPREA